MTRDGRPSRRGDALRVADIEKASIHLDLIREKGYEKFAEDPILQDAAVRCLEIIGEAAGEVSEPFRREHPDVPFRRMRGFASFAKHEYWEILVGPLWKAVEAIPDIRKALSTVRVEDPVPDPRHE